ncbi:DNA polymerase III subunit gamma/tau [Terracidiphilus sp.]|jgi:DNA polymerase-3 subunit gamma/tau|uniref:DNA polymerase III subunit gamma/tau n=1 Tax=Terracidiphilus sp. TaxID=1964191 RepID=UPI003C240C6D
MGYQVLARKYRPQRFADVAGQDHVTRTLLNALSQGRIAHGYIFSGHRGIGKTTIARILACALNCRSEIGSPDRPTPEPCATCDSCIEIRQGNAVDVIEIDAATNRGIDEIRELRDAARYSPARDKYKIYILDEAHQITDAAFNALLKTLEEPPSHVVFMMATTEPENIPQTIRSRCQHFSFHAVKFEDILAQLKSIAIAESVDAEEAALALLAEAGDGSMRDALSIMDQAIASAPVESGKPRLATEQIRDLMGSVPNAVFERLLEAVSEGQAATLMEQLHVLLNAGHSPLSLARQMVRYLRNALMAKLGGAETELLQISADERARAARTAALFTEEEITRNLQIVLRTFDDLNFRQEQRFHLELGLLKLVHAQRLLPLEEFLSGVAAGVPIKGSAPSSPARSAAKPTTAGTTASSAAPPSTAPSLSPFGGGGNWGSAPAIKQSSTVAVTAPKEPATQPAKAPMPFLVGAAVPEEAVEEAPAPAARPEAIPTTGDAPSADALRNAVVQALASGGHHSAATLLGAANWILDVGNLRIEAAGLGKKMLALTVNQAAEKIIRAELQRLGGPARFMVVPGEGGATGAPVSATPLAGSIQEEALNHPLVQKAKEIFNAEVRSVVDLRTR